jgi:hypothetical protein
MYLRYPDEFQTLEWLVSLKRPQGLAEVRVVRTFVLTNPQPAGENLHLEVTHFWFTQKAPSDPILLPEPLRTEPYPDVTWEEYWVEDDGGRT